MASPNDPQALLGRTVVGSDGEKIGKVGQVFLDDETGQPEWITVNTGLFGTKETFVPVSGASDRGGDLAVGFDKQKVKDAPNVDVDDGHLDESQEAELYRYYGMGDSYSTWQTGVGTTGRTDTGLADTSVTGAAGRVQTEGTTDYAARTEGYDTSGPTTDDAMTRSEEQVRVGTERVQTGRAKLRKYVTTENVTQTVPVTRETARIETEPITDENRDRALSGPDISEEEHEVVLTEERPVVQKETVPVERVRLTTDQETEQVEVNEQVRKEQIELDTDDTTTRTDNR